MENEEMQDMLSDLFVKMFANMTSDEKIEVMTGLIRRMTFDGTLNEEEPAAEEKEANGGMKEMMAKMMQGGENRETEMPEMMFKGMMPHCIKMMMPSISKKERPELVSGMIKTLMDQASNGMSDAERATFKAKIAETVNT